MTDTDLDSAAAAADLSDPAPARDRFAVTDIAYFAGNSLGLMPLAAEDAVAERMREWADLGVEAWFESGWLEAAHDLTPAMGGVVGAAAEEVAIAGSLTANLHLLLAALYRPTPDRYRILIDADAFPSDQYAVTSHVAWHGLDPADAVVRGSGEMVDDTVAVTLLAGVSYISGQVADIEHLTTRAHTAGALAIWDLAHAAGNVALSLHDWDVDAAAWCGYKYLNGGPGAPAGLFVHERHAAAPRLSGWWGVEPATRMKMEPEIRRPRRCRGIRAVDTDGAGTGAAGSVAGRVRPDRNGRADGAVGPADGVSRAGVSTHRQHRHDHTDGLPPRLPAVGVRGRRRIALCPPSARASGGV